MLEFLLLYMYLPSPLRNATGSYRGTALLQTAMNAPLEDHHVWESVIFASVTLQILDVLSRVTEMLSGL